ncbi:hypothetical protein A8C32_06225 [Flavivirga aquatica]|uniref:Uncharacterized protein n=1 Tax=Flavivirga aquatica TaxID=1849968 RepID=A0A1E5SI53_9FLAO|nr:hypothetical protein [Flavivirga aquatica]OEJ98790.1 hypothetical protein A8C32_06225 [Flavivirga aquatica]
MKKVIYLIALTIIMASCQSKNSKKEEATNQSQEEKIHFQNKAHELVYKMVQKTGTYDKLKALKNVVYTYTYRTSDQEEDVSIEKYIFEGEHSLGEYSKHERTLSNLKGNIIQKYNGDTFSLEHQNKSINDPELLHQVEFTRKTNFFWFTMMQKFLDPGIEYEYLRKETVKENEYDIVKISYKLNDGNPSDVYHLYINSKTLLVDQFLFTVVDHGIINKPLIMEVKYEKVNDILVPSYRRYTKSNWKGEILKDEWVEEISTNIKFNQVINKEEFK